MEYSDISFDSPSDIYRYPPISTLIERPVDSRPWVPMKAVNLSPTIDILLKCGGIIAGGSVVNAMLGITDCSDIDCYVSSENFAKCFEYLQSIGFRKFANHTAYGIVVYMLEWNPNMSKVPTPKCNNYRVHDAVHSIDTTRYKERRLSSQIDVGRPMPPSGMPTAAKIDLIMTGDLDPKVFVEQEFDISIAKSCIFADKMIHTLYPDDYATKQFHLAFHKNMTVNRRKCATIANRVAKYVQCKKLVYDSSTSSDIVTYGRIEPRIMTSLVCDHTILSKLQWGAKLNHDTLAYKLMNDILRACANGIVQQRINSDKCLVIIAGNEVTYAGNTKFILGGVEFDISKYVTNPFARRSKLTFNRGSIDAIGKLIEFTLENQPAVPVGDPIPTPQLFDGTKLPEPGLTRAPEKVGNICATDIMRHPPTHTFNMLVRFSRLRIYRIVPIDRPNTLAEAASRMANLYNMPRKYDSPPAFAPYVHTVEPAPALSFTTV